MDFERPVLARRFVQLQARCEPKRSKRQEEDPVLFPKRENTGRETENDTPKGKDLKVPVRQESQISQNATIFRRGKCQKESACDSQNPRTTNP